MKMIHCNFVKFQSHASRSNPSGVVDPMLVDAPLEENENNEEVLYEVDVDSFVRRNNFMKNVI